MHGKFDCIPFVLVCFFILAKRCICLSNMKWNAVLLRIKTKSTDHEVLKINYMDKQQLLLFYLVSFTTKCQILMLTPVPWTTVWFIWRTANMEWVSYLSGFPRLGGRGLRDGNHVLNITRTVNVLLLINNKSLFC